MSGKDTYYDKKTIELINSDLDITTDNTKSVNVKATTPSTSCSTGALTVAGGAGFAGDVNLCGTFYVTDIESACELNIFAGDDPGTTQSSAPGTYNGGCPLNLFSEDDVNIAASDGIRVRAHGQGTLGGISLYAENGGFNVKSKTFQITAEGSSTSYIESEGDLDFSTEKV